MTQEVINFLAGIVNNENPQITEEKINLNNQVDLIGSPSNCMYLRFRGTDCSGTLNISYKGRVVKQIAAKHFDTGESLILCDEIDAIGYSGDSGTAVAEGYFCKY